MIIHVDDEDKFCYVEIAKAGISSIKYELFWKRRFGALYKKEGMHRTMDLMKKNSLKPYKEYFKFTVIRNPYTRFMSAYFWGINKQHRKNLDLCRMLDIEDWPDKILNDPNEFLNNVSKDILTRNPHTTLQTYLLPKNLNELDYIGQLEKIEAVERKLSQFLDEEIKFEHLNKGQEINYYSIDINTDIFNHIFAEDYETLKDFYKPLKKAK